MRRTIDFNQQWFFTKEEVAVTSQTVVGETVTLPHTWNNIDGQDGGNDYHRGTCYYTKQFSKPEVAAGEQVYLSFEGEIGRAHV